MRTSRTVAAGLIVVIILSGLMGGFIGYSVKGNKTITIVTTSSVSINGSTEEQEGIVTGVVTVHEQTPSNISLYSVVFIPSVCLGNVCPGDQGSLAPIYPTGSYSALLAPGRYTVWLYPSCKWDECDTTFPQMVTVKADQQIVLNIDIPSPPPPPAPIASVPFNILLNGSEKYPTYTSSAGQRIMLVLRIDATQPVSLALSAEQVAPPGSSGQPGIVTELSAQTVNVTTTATVLLHISIGTNVAADTYLIEVIAMEQDVLGQIGLQAGFNLVVQ